MQNLTLTISDTAIRQDDAGRFLLNDLHRAAGGADKDKPSNWLRLDQTQGLVAEITGSLANCSDLSSLKPDPIKITEGRNGGTFVSRKLVYAYAMWISAAFLIKQSPATINP